MAGLLNLLDGDRQASTVEATSGAPDDSQLALFQDPKQGPLPEEAVPHLVVQLQDDLARSRRREAIWLSVITHLVLIITIMFAPKLPYFQNRTLGVIVPRVSDRDITFLAMPPDLQKPVTAPKTNVISDKNRIATSRTPTLNKEDLQRILDARRPGEPGRQQPPAPSPAAQQAQAPASPQQQQQQPATQMAKSNTPSAPEPPQLQSLPPQPQPGGAAPNQNPFNLGRSSAGQIAAATAPGRGSYGQGGEFGAGVHGRSNLLGNSEILSDTMGVDFGPYLQRVHDTVQRNWYAVMPPSAQRPFYAQGKVQILFRILKDGRVDALRLESSSRREEFDSAAMSGIKMSDPFQPLPKEFEGVELRLRFTFYYNPDKNEIPGGN